MEPNSLGTFSLVHFFFLLTYLLSSKQPKLNLNILLLTILAALTSLALSGSRAIYFLLVFLIIPIWIKFRSDFVNTYRLIPYKGYLVLASLLLMMAILPSLANRLSSINQLFTQEGSGSYRFHIASYALRLGLNNFFGVGLNLSPYYLVTSFPGEKILFEPDYPHTLLMQIFAETGIIGLAAFSFFVYLCFRPLFSSSYRLESFKYYYSALALFLAAQIYPFFLHSPEIFAYFMLYLGIANYQDSHA